MTTTLQLKDVYNPEKSNDHMRMFQDEVHGIKALIDAGIDISMGSIVRFAVCERMGETTIRTIKEVFTFALGYGGDTSEGYAERAARVCGENNDPNGAGSYALIASWYDYAADPAAITAALALKLGTGEFFRLHNAGTIKS